MTSGRKHNHSDGPSGDDGPQSPPLQGFRGEADLDSPPVTASGRLKVHLDPDHPPADLYPAISGATPPAHQGELRIGIIGTGVMAAAHAENFLKLGGCRLESCLDIDPGLAKAFASRFKFAHVAKDTQDLLSRCDAVAVVTPDEHHAGYVMQALRRNRHVLCEKPLTRTLAEARGIARAARSASARGVVGMVNYSYRCASAMHHAAWMRQQGRVGELRHVSAQYMQGWLATTHEPSGGALWRMRKADGGGVLADLGCHLLDMVSAVAGDITRVHCLFGNYPKISADGKPFTRWQGRPLDADDTAVITVEFAAGGMGCLQVTRWASGRQNTIRMDLHGTRGSLVFDLDHSYDQVHHHDVAAKTWRTEHPASAPSMWQRFVGAIRDSRAEQPDLIRGAQVQAYLEACRKSVASGGWEQIPPWE